MTIKVKAKRVSIKKIIKMAVTEAVDKAIEAERLRAKRVPENIYKSTENRLKALNTLKIKVAADKERLDELIEHGIHSRSNDVIRFSKSGRGVSDDDLVKGLIKDLTATIAADEFEIKSVEDALLLVEDDCDYLALAGRFFEGMSDDAIAEKLSCDERTVRRKRGRLMYQVEVRLYGADAV